MVRDTRTIHDRQQRLGAAFSDGSPWNYVLATLLPLAAIATTRWLLIIITPEVSPFIFALVTVFFVALISGLKPGLLATLVYIAGSAFFLAAPVSSLSIHDTGDQIRLLINGIVGVGLTLVGAKLRKLYHDVNTSRSLLLAIIDATADGILVVNRSGEISHFNDRFLKIWDLSRDFVSKSSRSSVLDMASQHLKQPEAFLEKTNGIYAYAGSKSYGVLEFKNGRLVERYSQPYSLDGQYLGRVLSFRDITKFEEAKAAMAQALTVRDDFLSIAAHELKTPLTALKMQIQLLRRLISTPEFSGHARMPQLANSLQGSENQLDLFVTLVSDMLSVSQMRAGKLSLNRKPTNLSAIVLEVIERYQSRWTESRCDMIFPVPTTVIGDWDPIRLEEVITNLLNNATKYGAGKPVAITVQQIGALARLTVRDHGIGISKEDLERIFVRFERASTIKSFPGFGLGLFISRQIIEAHAGKIWAESELGHGSTFTVELPLHPPQK